MQCGDDGNLRYLPAPFPHVPQFDYIVGMDAANLAAIRRAAEHWRGAGGGGAVPPDYGSKLSLMTDFLRSQQFAKFNEVGVGGCGEGGRASGPGRAHVAGRQAEHHTPQRRRAGAIRCLPVAR